MSRVSIRVAMTAAALLAGILTSCGTGSDPATGSVADRSAVGDDKDTSSEELPVVAPGTPCPGAVLDNPIRLASVSRAPVYLPDDGLAQVTRAWRCGSTPVFMIHDVQLSFEPGWENVKIPEKWRALARDYGGSVETIQGLPAWVAPSSASASDDEVLMIKDGAAIRLLARGDVPIDDLIAVANSLDLRAPIGS
jgi:hypothetical protein